MWRHNRFHRLSFWPLFFLTFAHKNASDSHRKWCFFWQYCRFNDHNSIENGDSLKWHWNLSFSYSTRSHSYATQRYRFKHIHRHKQHNAAQLKHHSIRLMTQKNAKVFFQRKCSVVTKKKHTQICQMNKLMNPFILPVIYFLLHLEMYFFFQQLREIHKKFIWWNFVNWWVFRSVSLFEVFHWCFAEFHHHGATNCLSGCVQREHNLCLYSHKHMKRERVYCKAPMKSKLET